MSRRRIFSTIAAVVALAVIAAIASALTSGGSTKQSKGEVLAFRPSLPAAAIKGHIADLLLRNGREGGHAGDPDAGPLNDPAVEAYADRAYPAASIAVAQTQAAAKAAKGIKGRGPKHGNGWQELGPFTLNVDQLATQTFNRGTQWSGRVTALAADPNRCDEHRCRLYTAAAGGGIWRSDNALARDAQWTFISEDIPSTAIGSLIFDPTDSSGRTMYAGTGEESGSSDSEAGIGLYKSTDRGDHWSLVAGSPAVSSGRGIGAITVDPSNANHIFIGTDVARHGASSVNGGRFTPPAAPPIGLYESTDGGATFHIALIRPSDPVDPASPNGSDFFRGGVTDLDYDPASATTLYVSMTDYGLFRSANNGSSFDQIYTATPDPDGFGIRYEAALTTLPNGKTRIYLADGSNEVADSGGNLIDASKLWRTDDARTATPAWQNLSSSDPGNPGFGSFDFCEAQCSYDMWVATPPGQPDTVWLGGSMHYDELRLYAGADRSDGRAVVRSTNAGASWTDMTGDARVDFEDQHPDTRDVVFAGPDIAFIGSDGGVIRTNGKYRNVSSQCDSRDLSGDDLTRCHEWLSAVPERLIPVNSGLRTLQFESLSVNPQDTLKDVMGGTQDNATMGWDGNAAGDWTAFVTGDGGNSGIDVANDKLRYHTYFSDQADVNFHGTNPHTWDWMMDPLIYSGEGASFYVPFVADPKVGGTAYTGANHVWRTLDGTGDPNFLDNHCYTNGGPKGDQLFSGSCGDWVMLGKSLRDLSFGTTRRGTNGSNYVAQIARTPSDSNTLWAATRLGRVLVTKNANATGHQIDVPDAFGAGVTLHNEDDVVWTRIDDGESATPVTPGRFPSGISIDATDSNHAIVTYSGYDAYATAAGTPTGHAFDVHFNPVTGSSTWTNISYDLGDQPITGVQLDSDTGDIYVATDFGVDVLSTGATSWVPASQGLPTGAVYGITLAGGKKAGDRVLYAATHGRGAWRLLLPDGKGKK
jgi:hypothetical protein